MSEKLQYYTDICSLIDYRLMKTLNDDTKDDPRVVGNAGKKDFENKRKPKVVNPRKQNDDDIDHEAGPTAPTSRNSGRSYNQKNHRK